MRPRPAPESQRTPEILLVDDNNLGLIVRKALLEELGYRITTARRGEEALDLFSNRQFDVVVTDLKMPGMDGVELIRRLRSQNPRTRVVLLSGFVEPLGLTENTTGADVVISKSASEAVHLTRWIKRLVEQPPARKPPASASRTPRSAKKSKTK
jgi:CheY-like chemotaxis protein